MDVLEHDDEWRLPSERLEHLAKCPPNLAGRRGSIRGAKCRGDRLDHGISVLVTGECSFDPADEVALERLVEHLADRPVRDPFAVGQAPSREDRRDAPERALELQGQSRLADPRWADDGEEEADLLPRGPVERLSELGELASPADERCFEPTDE